MKPLFLNPPTFEDFDGGAGARYQASREVTSFWYPVWLCYPAGMIEGSRVVDAPVQRLTLDDCLKIALDYDMVVIYTSTPTLRIDTETARRIKAQNPATVTVLTGPHVTVLPEETLLATGGSVDIVCRGEFDYAVKELAEGASWERVAGISYRQEGAICHTPDRPLLDDLDALPFVSQVYQRDLPINDYVIPHFRNPYVSIYSSRGCPSNCTYCLWPQTISGRAMRTRSPENVYREVKWIRDNLPQVRDISFDDDTFSADRNHARAVAEKIGPLGVSWTINARANTDYDTLKIMRDAGLHHVVVGYESGDAQILKNIRKGVTREQAEEFTRNCKKLGLTIHGAFIMGLPGETRETIRRNHRLRQKTRPGIDPGLTRIPLSRHRVLRPVPPGRVDLFRNLPGRHRTPELRHQLSPPLQPGDIRGGGALLQQVLLPAEVHCPEYCEDDRQRR